MLSDAPHHTPAALVVGGNNDLLTEILLQLPIRSLLRFKSVSTQWLSLISNPTFTLLRNSRVPSPKPISGLLLERPSRLIIPDFDFVPLNDNNDDDPPKPPFRTLNFVDDPCGLHILQSCNGLLLCCSKRRSPSGKYNYYIYNPTTNKFTTLPDPNRQAFRYFHGMVSIAFDPSKSPHYKAVCVYSSDKLGRKFKIEIYSSETGLWTPSGHPFIEFVHFTRPVYWNDSIHWISWGDSLYFYNLNTNRIRIMTMPPIMPDDSTDPFFGESGGHLHLIQIYGPQTTHFNVYEMEIDYSKWVVKYHVDLDSFPSAFPEMICGPLDPSNLYDYELSVLGIVRGEKDEDSFLVLRILEKAIMYNFVDKTFKKLCDFNPDDPAYEFTEMIDFSIGFGGWVNAFQFIESLAFV